MHAALDRLWKQTPDACVTVTHVAALCFITTGSRSQNVTITEGGVLSDNWLQVANGLGMNPVVYPTTVLDDTMFFAATDILVVSLGTLELSELAFDNILAYVQQRGRVYLQGEYDCDYNPTDTAFERLVDTFGGATFSYVDITSDTLYPVVVTGSFATTNNTVTPLDYFWFGCHGDVTAGCAVEPFLEHNGLYYGFIYCAPTPMACG